LKVAPIVAVIGGLLVSSFAPALTGSAHASQVLGDLDIRSVTLAANASGEALVTYRRADGRLVHVLASGAINAHQPDVNVPQVTFTLDYRSAWWSFKNGCSAYDGPALADVVTACKAPDGSYWAVQAWQRLLPMRGVAPWKPNQGALEFHLSHWTGPPAVLQVSQNWTYSGHWQGLFGRLTYLGVPQYGFSTPSATKRADGYARYVYIDTHDSVYGPGWRHDAGKVLHSRDGAFCYSFVPQRTPAGYPSDEVRGPGVGDESRVRVLGPGVTPDVSWVGPTLGALDPRQDAVFNALFDQWIGSADRVCTNER
jgi:hypothetical protein